VLVSNIEHAALPAAQAWEVPPERSSVRQARRLVLDAARHWLLPLSDDALQEVALCASELATNAVLYSHHAFTLTVRWTGERLRVEVCDTSLVPPGGDGSVSPGDGGRGLLLVAELAQAWGWHPRGCGKIVWFEAAADQAVGRQHLLSVPAWT
jgi:anti-sigma regulatory factor (Ser/Thr protein kinase)